MGKEEEQKNEYRVGTRGPCYHCMLVLILCICTGVKNLGYPLLVLNFDSETFQRIHGSEIFSQLKQKKNPNYALSRFTSS